MVSSGWGQTRVDLIVFARGPLDMESIPNPGESSWGNKAHFAGVYATTYCYGPSDNVVYHERFINQPYMPCEYFPVDEFEGELLKFKLVPELWNWSEQGYTTSTYLWFDE